MLDTKASKPDTIPTPNPMITTKYRTLLAAVLLATGAASASAQKVGMVDMNQIFQAYYETKDAEAKINEAREAARKELEEQMETFKGSVEAINKLNQEIESKALSDQAKGGKAQERDKKIAETRALEQKINEFRQTREKQLQDQMQRMRNGIVEKIIKVVQDRVKTGGYDIVFDKSGLSSNLVPIVLFSKDEMDFSKSVIDELNKTKPN